MTEKILKIKVGDVFIDGKNYSVFQTAFKKQSKKGEDYYETRNPIFIHEIKEKMTSEKIQKDLVVSPHAKVKSDEGG